MFLLSGTLQANTNIAAAQAGTHTWAHKDPQTHSWRHTQTNKCYTTPALHPSLSRTCSLYIRHSRFSHFAPISKLFFFPSPSHAQTPCLTIIFQNLPCSPRLIPEWNPFPSLWLWWIIHSPMKSPITSNRTVSSPLIFTKLSTHCGTELLVITFLSLTGLSGEYKKKIKCCFSRLWQK